MRTAIVTDSNSGIFEVEAQQLGVYVLPMPVMIEGWEYFEGMDLFHNDFYQSLLAHKQVSTSQPAPGHVVAL